jgi:hypothetical protein
MGAPAATWQQAQVLVYPVLQLYESAIQRSVVKRLKVGSWILDAQRRPDYTRTRQQAYAVVLWLSGWIQRPWLAISAIRVHAKHGRWRQLWSAGLALAHGHVEYYYHYIASQRWRMATMRGKRELTSLYLNPEVIADLRRLSAHSRIPVQAYLREAIDDLLKKYAAAVRRAKK